MKFNIGDKLHISGDIKITGEQSHNNGSYSYNTNLGVAFPAYVLEQLTAASVKPQDKPKFAVGCKAKVIANTCHHHMMIGDIVTLTDNTHIFAGVLELPAWHYKEHSPGFISERDLEPYAEPKRAAPVKLYCVKSYRDELIKGKVYEFDGHRVNYEHIECFYATDFEQWKRGDRSYSACLVPLVSRPAKAGEWVYIAKSPYSSAITDGAVLRVVNSKDRYVDVKGDIDTQPSDGYLWHVLHGNYLTLDGYDGRYEHTEPQYYNGDIICIEARSDSVLKQGHKYHVKNGILEFAPAANYYDKPKSSIEEINKLAYPFAKFVEYKGEAT